MNRTIVVTGSATGMGKATADLLRSNGDRVIGVDYAQAQGVDIIADLSEKIGRLYALEEIAKLSPDYIDGAITWAGSGNPTTPTTLAVNYFGQVEVLEGLRPLLEKSKAPRVVVTVSRMILPRYCPQLVDLCLDGKEKEALELSACLIKNYTSGEDSSQTYICSKVASTRWMRRNSVLPQWGGKGILMNAIAPGVVETPMTKPVLDPSHPRSKFLFEAHPQVVNLPEHIMQPEETAHLAAFLLSPEQSVLVGQVLYMDYGTEAIVRGDKVW